MPSRTKEGGLARVAGGAHRRSKDDKVTAENLRLSLTRPHRARTPNTCYPPGSKRSILGGGKDGNP
jgi:hypothetical protein